MNLLDIIREHARRQGLPVPSTAISSSDAYVQRCIGLLNEFCDDLDTRKVWQSNVRSARFLTTASESQGRLHALAPFEFAGIVPNSLYNQHQHFSLESVSSATWQQRTSRNLGGPFAAFRIRGGELLFNPAPAAGQEISFEYYSSAFVYFPGTSGANGQPATYRRYFENDADESTVSGSLAIAYLRWAYLRSKGFDYAEEFAKYERMVFTLSARNDAPVEVRMDGPYLSARPGHACVIVGPGIGFPPPVQPWPPTTPTVPGTGNSVEESIIRNATILIRTQTTFVQAFAYV